MTLLRAAITGNLRAAMDRQVVGVARALRFAVQTAGKQTQTDLRAQARGAGFRDGGRALANSWRLEVFPKPGIGPRSLRPAASVSSRMAEVAMVFDRGAVVRAKGRRYLAIPTPVNRVGNKRSQDGRFPTRVTPQEMVRGGGFVVGTSNPDVRLWCLPLRTEAAKRGRVLLFAGRYAQVLTGNRKGAEALRKQFAAERRFVPMFFLMRQVTLRKRLNIAQVQALAPGRFATAARAELARIAA
jgi:hypothetical protein